MKTLIVQLVVWTLCAVAFWIAYWNYSRYVEAKLDPEQSERNLRIALHARNDGAIEDAEFEKIESSHYRPFRTRFRIALIVGIVLGITGGAILLG